MVPLAVYSADTVKAAIEDYVAHIEAVEQLGQT
jgi:hypothetical protein